MGTYWFSLGRPLVEILLLWFIIYVLLIFIRGTRTVQVIKGIIILLLIFVVTQWLGLSTINWILTKLIAISVIAFLIIFQPELRRGLARLGQFGFTAREEEILDDVVKSTIFLSNRKIGGIIALEREIGLRPYVESGVTVDSKVTSELINTIFMPGTPLHDGGIVIKNDRVLAAGCLFPLTQNPHISKMLGTRHRAAIGLSEETDSVCVVISEETGAISIAVGGKLTKDLNRDTLPKVLENLFKPKGHRRSQQGLFRMFGGRGR
jgi:diadenylate cyclase